MPTSHFFLALTRTVTPDPTRHRKLPSATLTLVGAGLTARDAERFARRRGVTGNLILTQTSLEGYLRALAALAEAEAAAALAA